MDTDTDMVGALSGNRLKFGQIRTFFQLLVYEGKAFGLPVSPESSQIDILSSAEL